MPTNNHSHSKIREVPKTSYIKIYLSEYEKLRDSILNCQQRQERNLIISLGSITVLLPILLNQINNIPESSVAALFYFLAFIYNVLSMNYVYWGFEVMATSNYIHNHLEFQLNQITKSKSRVLNWESYIRKKRSRFIPFVLSSMGPSASMFLILLPSVVSLATACYLLLRTVSATSAIVSILGFTSFVSPTTAILGLTSFALPTISIIAWISFAISIAVGIIQLLYIFNTAHYSS